MEVPEAMGSAIAINFQGTGGGKAAITGDFVLTADEVNPVLRALRSNGIEVTAVHNHMLDDEPRLFFWGRRSPHEATCRSIASSSHQRKDAAMPLQTRSLARQAYSSDRHARTARFSSTCARTRTSPPTRALVPGSVRRSLADVPAWAQALAGRSAVVICQKGLKLSHGVAAWLRHDGARPSPRRRA